MRARLTFTLLSLLAFPTFAAITGTVINRDGQALAGAKISVFALETVDARSVRVVSRTPERQPLATVQADAKGSYSITVPPGPAVVDLRAEARGYAPAQSRVQRDDETGAIGLTRADMKQGTMTAKGKPLAGATVLWMSGLTESVAVTDENGRYSAPDPSKWANRLVVIHPDYALLEEAGVGPLGTLHKKGLDRTLREGMAVKGRVVAADGKTPVAKASLHLDGWPLVQSGEDGTFTITQAPRKWETLLARSGGLYAVRAQAPGLLTLRLAKAATVGGTVRDAKTRLPMQNAEVRLAPRMMGDARALTSTFSDAKGNYTLTAPPGAYEVSAARTEYAASESAIAATAGQSLQRQFSLNPLARISGTVLDDDKRAVAGAQITPQAVSEEMGMMMMVRMPRPSLDAMSGPDGRFVLRTAGERELHVQANRKGFPTAKSSSFRIGAGERKSGVVVTIPRGLALTGRVTDREGKPLSGVSVAASDAQRTGGPMRRVVMMGMNRSDDDQVQTASDGTFTIRLKQGAYDVAFKRDGFAVNTLRNQQVAPDSKPLEVVLEPGAEISGRVVRGSMGIEGVNVFAFGGDNQASAITGPDGSFTISDLTPGPMMVTAAKPDDFIQQMRTITAPAKDVVFDVPAGGRIAGRVVDKTSKQPVTNFQAGLSRVRGGGGIVFAGPPQMKSFTTDDGTFVLDGVPPGQQTVVVQAAGYAEGRVPSIAVEEGKTIADVVVEVDRGVKVTGRVTGPDGSPLTGATVRLAAQSMMGSRIFSPTDPATVTDSSGEYTLEGIEAGEKTLEFMQQGLISTQKTVQLSGREARVDAQLTAGVRVSGQVVTQSGMPVAEASVFARSGSSSMFGGGRATTDASGMFTLEGLTPGRYTITASKQGNATGSVEDFDISSGAPIRIVLPAGGVIYGRVSGLSDADLRQVTVRASGSPGGASSVVDASGNYRIEGAPTGTVRVAAYVENMAAGRSSPAKSVTLEAGGSVQVDIDFPVDIVVRGRVTREGKPVAGARVMFVSSETTSRITGQASSDENGQYSITGLTNGAYTVSVIDMQRLAPFTTSYDVKGSGSFDIDIRAAQLRGRVSDAANGEPLGRAAVQIRSGATGPEAMFAARATETDDSGAFLIDSITPGTYNATISKEGYASATREVVVRESGTDAVEIKLGKSDGVSLRVVDARDRRLLNANVTVYDAQNRVVHEEMFRFGVSAESVRLALAPGQYRATVSADGYAPRNVIITSPGQQYVELTPGGTIVVRSKGSAPRRARMMDATGQPYSRYRSFNPTLTIDPSPGTTTLRLIAPGTYTIQILGDRDMVISSQVVTVTEGQTVTAEM